MKIAFIAFFYTTFFLISCRSNSETTMEDLGQTMMDLRIYQENLGDMIRSGRLEDAQWLLDGTDSLLQVMANTFREHRKLRDPFSYTYRKRLKTPLRSIDKAIKGNDTAAAMKNYRLLVRRCNSCHTDLDVDKQVNF
ncbi:MAG TPA: hypothetical protein VFX58_06050 [Chitinophagaceae bacterium]|nr:hypothetical protein [Chitinophagaceae bacterium]